MPVESERMRGAPTSWVRRGGIRQDAERTRPNEGHSSLETTEETIRRDTGRMRPREVCQQPGPEEGGTCWERERARPSEGHSPLEAVGGDTSRHREMATS